MSDYNNLYTRYSNDLKNVSPLGNSWFNFEIKDSVLCVGGIILFIIVYKRI